MFAVYCVPASKKSESEVNISVDSRREHRQGVGFRVQADANGKKEGRFEKIVTYAVPKYPPAVSV